MPFGTYWHSGSIIMIYPVAHQANKTLDQLKLGAVHQEGRIYE